MNLITMLPFLEDEQLEKLLEKIMQSSDGEWKGITLPVLLPLLSDSVIERLMMEAAGRGEKVTVYAPFASSETLHKLTVEYVEGRIRVDMDSLYPFLVDEDIKLLFQKAMDEE